jgi:hypothetical protein
MNLRATLEDALNQSTEEHRKSSFGRDKRAKADIAAEAAEVALEKLREVQDKSVDLDGKARGIEMMLERAERLLERAVSEVDQKAAEVDAKVSEGLQRFSGERLALRDLLEATQEERANVQVDLANSQSLIKGAREEAISEINRRIQDLEVNQNVSSNVHPDQPGDDSRDHPGPEGRR